MLRPRRSSFAPLLVSAAALAAGAGCGGESTADTEKGKQLFTQRCGSCHVLADAETRGVIGPNLDTSFARAIEDGLGRDTVRGVVREQIAFPQGGQMPANLVTGADADAVAAYVAEVAGKEGGGSRAGGAAGGAGTGGGAGGGDGGGGTARANSKNELTIPADPTGQLAYEFQSATADAGKVTLVSKNDSTVPHNIAIKDGTVADEGPVVSGGKESRVSVDLESGRYTFYCSVPGHEQGGMKGALTVR